MADSTREPSAESEEHRDQTELERALSAGEGSGLPPNTPKGLLGQVQPDLRQAESFEPDLNAGLSQETDAPVVFLAILLAYFIFFPLAFVIVWRSRHFTTRWKYAMTAAMIVGLVVFAVAWFGR